MASAAVCSRNIAGKERRFSFSPRHYQGNVSVEDTASSSIWSQLAQSAVEGPLEGTRMQFLPSIQTSWEHWQSIFPNSTVPKYPVDAVRAYQYPRQTNAAELKSGTFVENTPAQRQDLVLAVVIDGVPKAFPFRELQLAGETPVRCRWAGRELLVHYKMSVPAAWVTKLDGELLPSTTVKWYGWKEFYPDGSVFRAELLDHPASGKTRGELDAGSRFHAPRSEASHGGRRSKNCLLSNSLLVAHCLPRMLDSIRTSPLPVSL